MTVDKPQLGGRHVPVAAVFAAVGSGLIYLLEHFLFRDDWGWVGVAIFFVVLFSIYLAGPWIRRLLRGPQNS